MTFLYAFLASYFFIATKCLQQRQVVHDEHWYLIIATSVLMAVFEVFVVHNIAIHGWSVPLVLSVGLGSGCGCVTAMQLHKRFRLNGRSVQTHGRSSP